MWPDCDTVGVTEQKGGNPTCHQVIMGIKRGHF